MSDLWSIASQGAVNQYHEVVILERGDDRIGVWLPRDRNLDFVVMKASVERIDKGKADTLVQLSSQPTSTAERATSAPGHHLRRAVDDFRENTPTSEHRCVCQCDRCVAKRGAELIEDFE